MAMSAMLAAMHVPDADPCHLTAYRAQAQPLETRQAQLLTRLAKNSRPLATHPPSRLVPQCNIITMTVLAAICDLHYLTLVIAYSP